MRVELQTIINEFIQIKMQMMKIQKYFFITLVCIDLFLGLITATSFFLLRAMIAYHMHSKNTCISYARQSQFLRINCMRNRNRKSCYTHFLETGLICFFKCHICHTFFAAHNYLLYHNVTKKVFNKVNLMTCV